MTTTTEAGGMEAEIIAIIRDELDWRPEIDPDEAVLDVLGRISKRIAALDRAAAPQGFALVPVEPTEAMLRAGGSACDYPSTYMGGPSRQGQKTAEHAYRAMIRAAAPQTEGAKP